MGDDAYGRGTNLDMSVTSESNAIEVTNLEWKARALTIS